MARGRPRKSKTDGDNGRESQGATTGYEAECRSHYWIDEGIDPHSHVDERHSHPGVGDSAADTQKGEHLR